VRRAAVRLLPFAGRVAISKSEIREIFGPGNGCPMATNVVLVIILGVLVVITVSYKALSLLNRS